MNDLNMPIYSLNKFLLLGGSYKIIRTLHVTKKSRFEECKLQVGGKSYTGIIRFRKYDTAIMDILEDGPTETKFEDFWETCRVLEEMIPEEELNWKLNIYSVVKDIIIVMRILMVVSSGIFMFRVYMFDLPAIVYVFAASLVFLVFRFSKPLMIECMMRM